MSKILRVIVLIILVLIIVVVVGINLFADHAVKVGIESAATRALEVEVAVRDVDFSIMGGKLVLQNFSIGNPPVYQNDKLLVLRNTEIDLEAKSLLSDVVNIRQIKIDRIDVIIEQHSVSENNLHDVLQTAFEITEDWKQLRIDNLEISDITVKVDLMTSSGQTEPITLALSPINMTNLGHDNKMYLADLLKEIISAIADSVVKEGIGVLPTDIVGTMTSTLNKTIDLGTRIIEGKEDIGKEITEGLKNLLKPRQEE